MSKRTCISSFTKRKYSTQQENEPSHSTKAFSSLLRNSAFVGLGDISGSTCEGIVLETAGSNLFVDYGGKFLCVCQTPRDVPNKNWIGTHVDIKILTWELSAKFIGATKDVTLLESEGIITKVHS